jgi:hypothetical protein
MVRLIGEGAHVGDAHVEQMARVAGRVGQTPANVPAGFDEQDLGSPRIEPPREVNRRQRARGPAPDNRNSYLHPPHRPAIGLANLSQ